MQKKIFVTMLLVCALTSVAVYGAWAQEASVVGVKEGDSFKYSFAVFWSAADPNKIVPQEFADGNNTLSIQFNVTTVGPQMVYMNISNMMRDGTRTFLEVRPLNVLTGYGVDTQYIIISANLSSGDKAYPLSDPDAVKAGAAAESFTIDETVTRTYLGASKTVNHYSEKVTNVTTGNYVNRNAYYDKETGVLMEMTIEQCYSDLEEIYSQQWKIVQFNSASAPPDGTNDGTDGTDSTNLLESWLVPIAIVVVVVVVAVLVAVVLLRRRGKTQVQPPAQTSPQAPV